MATTGEPISLLDAVAFAEEAFLSECREEMLCATFLLGRLKRSFGEGLWPRIDAWIDRVDNWETCDQLAMGVAGELFARAPEPSRARWMRDLIRWSAASNPWRRRSR